jgi:hypothetical protein
LIRNTPPNMLSNVAMTKRPRAQAIH